MMRSLLAVCAVSVGLSAFAEAIVLAPHETKVVSVTAGVTEAQDGRVFVSSEAKLVKTGAGEWQVPVSQVDQPQPFKVTVQEGSVSFPATGGTALPETYELPEAIREKAYFWVDASDKDASHFAGTTGENGEFFVDRWHDVRETNPSAPTRMYCTAERRHTTLSPQKVTTNGFDAIWFGGFASGRAYNWRQKNGALHDTWYSMRHVFAVHGVEESYGNIFGSTNGSASTYVCCWGIGTKADSLKSTYFWNSEWSDVVNGHVYVNGERIDGTQTVVKKGFQLLEADTGDVNTGYVSCFYSRGTDKNSAGGDFLCEALAFAVELTEAERLAVQDYLMHKWFGKSRPVRQVELARSASAKFGDGLSDFSPRGNGTVVKADASDFVRDFSDGVAFEGALDVSGGSVTLGSPLAVKAQGGDRLTSAATLIGPQVSVAKDAPAEAIVKDGLGSLTVTDVPAGVRSVDVRGGLLAFRAPVTNDALVAALPTEVAVPNADFEDVPSSEMPGGVKDLNIPGCGWKYISGNSLFVYDYTVWTTGVVKQADGASCSAWGCNKDCPPAGPKALVVRGEGSACYADVTIPEAGIYEFSCQLMFRSSMTIGHQMTVSLTDASNQEIVELARFGCPSADSRGKFRRQAGRAFVPMSGACRLRFKSLHSGGTFMLDDLHLTKCADGWSVPNGGFDLCDMPRTDIFTNTSTATGWMFTEQAGWTCPDKKGRPSVGLTVLGMAGKYRTGGYYNASRGLNPYDVELLMRGTGGANGVKAETTFTPLAGTHYLQATLARFGENAAGLAAQVTVGGKTVELGIVTPKGKLMEAYRWPVPFTASGNEAVTLQLSLDEGISNSRGVLLDDLMLCARAPEADGSVEWIKNGNFENGGNDWTTILDPTADQKGCWRGRSYGEANWAFGWDPIVAAGHFTTLYKHGGQYQEVKDLQPGRYRLSCLVKGRAVLSQTTYYPHPLDVYVAKDGVTNWIGRTPGGIVTSWPTNHVREAFDFTIREAGTYHVGFVGRWDESYPEQSETHLDEVSLRQVPAERDRSLPFAEDAEIRVAADACLRLDFDGTNKVGRIRLGGRAVSGDVSAATHPDYIVGEGVLHADRRGMVILFR